MSEAAAAPAPCARLDCRDDVAILTLARPPVNAVDLAMVRRIDALIHEIAASDARGLVLTGLPGYFCAGLDTRVVPHYGRDERRAILTTINRVIAALYGLPVPVIAAVSGHAIGAGAVLPLTADERIGAAGDYRLGLTEAAAGIPFPAAPLTVCRAELSARELRHLALTSRTMPPDEAVSWGLLDSVVPAERLVDTAVERARTLARQPGFAAVKRQLRRNTIRRLEDIVEREDEPLIAHWVER